MKKAIVFGGAGFVGSHVADALTEFGIQTTIFDLHVSKYINEKILYFWVKSEFLKQNS